MFNIFTLLDELREAFRIRDARVDAVVNTLNTRGADVAAIVSYLESMDANVKRTFEEVAVAMRGMDSRIVELERFVQDELELRRDGGERNRSRYDV